MKIVIDFGSCRLRASLYPVCPCQTWYSASNADDSNPVTESPSMLVASCQLMGDDLGTSHQLRRSVSDVDV